MILQDKILRIEIEPGGKVFVVSKRVVQDDETGDIEASNHRQPIEVGEDAKIDAALAPDHAAIIKDHFWTADVRAAAIVAEHAAENGNGPP